MSHSLLLRTAATVAAMTLNVSISWAAPKMDLERVKPVPADQPIPMEDYFRPSLFRSPTLNSAGTHIAALFTRGDDRYQLLSYELQTQKIETLNASGDCEIYGIEWLDNKRIIFGLSSRKLYGLGLFAVNIGRFDHAYPLLQYYGSSLISIPVKRPLRPLVWARRDSTGESTGDLGVVVVNTDDQSGKAVNLLASDSEWADVLAARQNNQRHVLETYLAPTGGISTGYMADKMGELEFAFTSEKGVSALHRWTGQGWEKCPVDLDTIRVIDVGNEPGQLIVLAQAETGKPWALRFMDSATGALGEILLQDKAYDFDGWLYRDPNTHNVMGAIYDRNGPHVAWFSEDYKNLQKVLSGFFPNLVVRLRESDADGKRFLVSTFSDRQPTTYYCVDLEKKSVALIKSSAPWIDPARMQPMNTLKFKTRDGFSLDAYLTLPAGASKKNPPPLVVLPHGGPWVRDSWGYDGEVQFLASRGYAVLQPNYRGSPGYGWMFPEEDRWAFRKMHDDVTDAVKTVIAAGYVDSGRVAIMGGSFGGYLAISGVVNEPTMYRCGVTIAGVFDWAAVIKDAKYDQYDDPEYSRLLRKLGDPAKQAEKFAAISPLRRIDQVKVPVFVSHGKEDPVVGVNESKRLISELKKYNVTHEVLLVSEEGHGMGRLKNRLELYERIEAFLAKYLLPAAPAPAAASAE